MADGPANPRLTYDEWVKLTREEKTAIWRREQLDQEGNIHLQLPTKEFTEYAQEAKDEADWKHLVCSRRFYVWPSEIKRIEFLVGNGFVTITAIMRKGRQQSASAEDALPDRSAAVRGYEVSDVRPTPEAPQDWKPF